MGLSIKCRRPQALHRRIHRDVNSGLHRLWEVDNDGMLIVFEGAVAKGRFDLVVRRQEILCLAVLTPIYGRDYHYTRDTWALAHGRLLQLILVDYNEAVESVEYTVHEGDEL